MSVNNKDQVSVISRLVPNRHEHLKLFAHKLGLSLAGSKMDLLVRMADFLLTERGLKQAKLSLPPRLVHTIYEAELDSDEEEKQKDTFFQSLDRFNEAHG